MLTVSADGNCSGTIGAYTLISKSDNCSMVVIVEEQSPAASTVLNGHNDAGTSCNAYGH